MGRKPGGHSAHLRKDDEDGNVTQAGAGRQSHERRRIPRWLAWTGSAVLVLLIAAGVVVAYLIHNAEPILRQRVIASLENRFNSPVELDTLHISLLRGLQVSGSGLRILYFGEADREDAHQSNSSPMLSVRRFEFHAGLFDLFRPTMHVGVVKVDGMKLNIPPKQERGPLVPHNGPNDPDKLKRSIVLDEIMVSDMALTIETNKPGKLPLLFEIHDVTLHDVGPGKAFPFEAFLVNPKPLGDIHSTGHFGPWNNDNPRDSPVDGDYTFSHADLGTIKGISGILSSTGYYSGTLGEIGVTGTTDTPDFALDMSEHPMDLKTEFNATVDGTSGDTRLNTVRGTFLHTVLQVNGTVIRASHEPGATPDASGHFIDLFVVSGQARVEDILRLGVKTSPPLMQGDMTLRAHLTIPPGPVSVTKKMQIQGTFKIHSATFSNVHWQETVDKLSERACGNPEQANAQDATHVSSEMGGSFALADATISIPKLNYQMPGAQVELAGKYSLDGKAFDFNGTVRTKATASEMLTGWKSLIAKPFDPLLKKNGAGVEVPIVISGTKSDPKLGLDLGKLGASILTHRKIQPPQIPGEQTAPPARQQAPPQHP